MSFIMSRLIGASSISSPYTTSLSFNPTSHAVILRRNDVVLCSRSSFKFDPMLKMERRNFIVRSNITPPGVPLPSGSPSGSLRNWIVGIVLTCVLPFFTHKWGPLSIIKNRVDTVVNTAEHIMETIEEVAERVDKVIDSITDDLPENSKLRQTMESVDQFVEGVAKTAHIANDVIDKVEEAEDKLESLILHEVKTEKEQVVVEASASVQVVEEVEEAHKDKLESSILHQVEEEIEKVVVAAAVEVAAASDQVVEKVGEVATLDQTNNNGQDFNA